MNVSWLENGTGAFWYYSMPYNIIIRYDLASGNYTVTDIARFISFLMGYVVNRLDK